MERRYHTGGVTIEERADKSPVIVGYAAVFYRADDAGTQYQLWRNIYERIMPGAFSRAISEGHNAAGLFNHEPSQILGRVASNTVRLSVDSKGLRYEIDPPDTQIGRDVVTSIRRGDVTGSSFGFLPTKVQWVEEGNDRDESYREIREIHDVDLWDVSPVTFPAYRSTEAGMRGADESIEEILKERRERRRKEVDAILSRARCVAVG